jgi:hypothetical protein
VSYSQRTAETDSADLDLSFAKTVKSRPFPGLDARAKEERQTKAEERSTFSEVSDVNGQRD